MSLPSSSSLTLAATASIFAALFIRRRLRISAALSAWSRLAADHRLSNAPPHLVRVVITGVSSGVGRACVKLLSKYPCIDIVAMGRASSSQPLSCAEYIAVDLARPSQVAAAASLLAKKWYSDSVSSPFQSPLGHDIVINNAGVFTGIDSGIIWATNTHAPILISRAITEAWIATEGQRSTSSRSLRIVQVGSRLEKSSHLGKDNARQKEQQAMSSDTNSTSSSQAYADSKRALLLYTAHMSAIYAVRSPRLTFAVVTPGMVDTSLGKRSLPAWLWHTLKPFRYLMMKHSDEVFSFDVALVDYEMPDYEMSSAASDVLCAAFNESNGVYMADSGRVIENICETRDIDAGAEVALLAQQHVIAAPVSTDGEWAQSG